MKKLKVFITNSGFFEFAVAAPSRKAAIDLLGLGASAFQHGLAEETSDPDISATLLAKPGIVLQRPVGTKIKFLENATLTKLPPAKKPAINKSKDQKDVPRKKASKSGQQGRQEQVDRRRAREDIAKAKAIKLFVSAQQRHAEKKSAYDKQISAIDARRQEEEDRWGAEKKQLLKEI